MENLNDGDSYFSPSLNDINQHLWSKALENNIIYIKYDLEIKNNDSFVFKRNSTYEDIHVFLENFL